MLCLSGFELYGSLGAPATTPSLKLVGSRMTTATTFSRQNDAAARMSTTYY